MNPQTKQIEVLMQGGYMTLGGVIADTEERADHYLDKKVRLVKVGCEHPLWRLLSDMQPGDCWRVRLTVEFLERNHWERPTLNQEEILEELGEPVLKQTQRTG